MVQQKPLTYTLVLDLDGVLLHNPSEKITEEHTFFLEKSFLPKDSYGYNYIVPAYCAEFLKFAVDRFTIAFFSAGDGQRNSSVVQDIWIKVFGCDKPEQIKVLCRESLTDASDEDGLQPESDKEEYWYGNYKKDITKITDLSKAVLIDDDKSWVIKDQKANFLRVPPSHFGKFTSLIEEYKDLESYNDEIKKILDARFRLEHLFGFYKLVYIAGLLDRAAQRGATLQEGLYAIQFGEGRLRFSDLMYEIDYYKRGYHILSSFSEGPLPSYFLPLEKHFYS